EAKQLVAFDMQEVARQAGSVISSALFGALAGAEVLPFAREQFEQAIAAGGVGVEASLAAFAKAYELAKGEPQAEPQPQTAAEPPQLPETAASPSAQKLLARIKAEVPEPCQWLAFNGVKQLVDYQDPDYAHQYLDRLAPYFEKDSAENHYRLATALIKQLALWMAFQDTIRVAEQKIQAPRMATIRREVKASDDQLVYPVEYLHPRPEEVCDSLPKAIGEWALNNPFARRFIDGLFGHGRKLQTGRLSGFIPLYTLAKLKPWRRKTLRYAKEDTEIQSWLKRTEQALAKDYDSACEIIECQALIKGYSDTHANGYKNYQAIMAVVDIWLEETDANPIAERLRSLQRAALSGEDDSALQAALIQF
ncbi:MAG: indolepyruvate oxidoreductase subunit beta family protein, partial [Cellvibrionaceae bacterium]|nr:indolepyruvate oxidoreductase subunit beta family protein [Cellvibrionaceae bacterium]